MGRLLRPARWPRSRGGMPWTNVMPSGPLSSAITGLASRIGTACSLRLVGRKPVLSTTALIW